MTGAHEYKGNDLGILAGRLLFAIEDEIYERMHKAGYPELEPRHGAVLAYLSPDGARATQLARMSGQRKQAIGHVVDDLEGLGYVTREPDPADRRAKLVVPTAGGWAAIVAADAIMADIMRRHARHLGEAELNSFLDAFRAITDHQREAASDAEVGDAT